MVFPLSLDLGDCSTVHLFGGLSLFLRFLRFLRFYVFTFFRVSFVGSQWFLRFLLIWAIAPWPVFSRIEPFFMFLRFSASRFLGLFGLFRPTLFGRLLRGLRFASFCVYAH